MADRLTPDEVRRIAALAHLELTEEETVLFTRQLADILGYAAEIRTVDTSDVPPTSHVLAQPIDRPDDPRPSLPGAASLANAPAADRAAGLFKVPRVIG